MKHEMRTITTVEELDALPVGAIIKESPDGPRYWTFELTEDGDWMTWGSSVPYESRDIGLPATLLHPLRFGTGDVATAARALTKARYDGCPLEDLADIHLAEALIQASAVLATIGEVQG